MNSRICKCKKPKRGKIEQYCKICEGVITTKPKEIKYCPFCGKSNVRLETAYIKFIAGGEIFKGDRWVYKCPDCTKDSLQQKAMKFQ